MTTFRAACIQNTATRDIEANVDWVSARIDEAAAAGAEFIALPETVGLIEPVNEQIPAATYSETDDIGLAAFRGRARQHEQEQAVRLGLRAASCWHVMARAEQPGRSRLRGRGSGNGMRRLGGCVFLWKSARPLSLRCWPKTPT